MIRIEKIFFVILISICLLIGLLIVGTFLEVDILSDSVYAFYEYLDIFKLEKIPENQKIEEVGDWELFRYEDYGFEIRFPRAFSQKTVYNRKGINAGVGVNSEDVPVWQFRLDDAQYYQGTNLVDASIVINVAHNEEAVSACSQFKQGSMIRRKDQGAKNPSSVEINDIHFFEDRVAEGAMGQQYEKIIYSAVHEGACYQITLLLQSLNMDAFAESNVKEFSRKKVIQKLESAVSTFQFLDVEPTFPKQILPSKQESVSKSIDKVPDGYVDGIDVSHWQGDINWEKVAGAGYKFAFAKATEGVGFTDWEFSTNTEEGTAAGVLMGAYHYARPDLNNTGAEEAEFFLSVVGDYIEAGYLRPVLDLEVSGDLTKEEISAWTVEWMETVKEETGVEPLIYTYYYYILENFDNSVKNYDLWIAYWNCDPTPTHDIPPTDGFADWDFWQYQAPGGCGYYSIPGISGSVDLDIFNGIEEELAAFESDAPLWVSLKSDAYQAPKPYFADLTVDVNGSATGPMDLALWWDCNDLGNDIGEVMGICGNLPIPEEGHCLENEIGMKCNALENENQLAEHTYEKIGDYTPKVIVERGSEIPAEDRYKISVLNPIQSVNVYSFDKAAIGFDHQVEVDVEVNTSLSGVLQVEILRESNQEIVDQACKTVPQDKRVTKTFSFLVQEQEEGIASYIVWVRYRVDSECSILDMHPDDRSESFMINWIIPKINSVGFYTQEQLRWYMKYNHSDGWNDYYNVKFGAGDGNWIPVTGDWNGDGKDTPGFYSPDQKSWYFKLDYRDGWNNYYSMKFGARNGSWKPVTGDWDGDGQDTPGFYNHDNRMWYLKNDHIDGWTNFKSVKFGARDNSWKPVVGDWISDGKDTVGFYDPDNRMWHLNRDNSNGWNNFTSVRFGARSSEWEVIAGDWDGNLVASFGFYNPGNNMWYLKNSMVDGWNDFISVKFGAGGDEWKTISGHCD